MPFVGVVMGSRSDEPAMQGALDVLDSFGVSYEVRVLSAHRTPDKAREYGMTAQERGLQVIIAGAGAAAHLPGVMASWTTIPVIGVPLASSELRGLDALYAIVQMPPGVPVAAVAVGSAGARNAGHLAAQILALQHPDIRERYEAFRQQQAQG